LSDLELIAAARAARADAHGAWKNIDGNRPTDWSGSSRRLQELLDEIERRGLDRGLVFQD
jgi:hypothetical protein